MLGALSAKLRMSGPHLTSLGWVGRYRAGALPKLIFPPGPYRKDLIQTVALFQTPGQPMPICLPGGRDLLLTAIMSGIPSVPTSPAGGVPVIISALQTRRNATCGNRFLHFFGTFRTSLIAPLVADLPGLSEQASCQPIINGKALSGVPGHLTLGSTYASIATF
jgi:hypothetical protein